MYYIYVSELHIDRKMKFIFELLIGTVLAGMSFVIIQMRNKQDKIDLELELFKLRDAITGELPADHPLNEPNEDLLGFKKCDIPDRVSMEIVPNRGIPSTDWCEERVEQIDVYLDMCLQMKRTAITEGYDGLIGSDFDLLKRVGYVREVDMCMLNPIHREIKGPKEYHTCEEFDSDGNGIQKLRLKVYKLEFRNPLTRFATSIEKIFEGKAGCVVQSMIDGMKGK